MDLFSMLFLAHLAGVIIAVGGATMSDALFHKTIKNKNISQDEFKLLKEAGKVIWPAYSLAVLSGIGLVANQYIQSGSLGYVDQSYFQAKIAIIGIIGLNGIVFHRKILPFMKDHLGESMRVEEFTSRFWLFSLTGAISIVSWWTVVILAVLSPSLPLIFILNIYLLVVALGALFGYLMITHTVFGDKDLKESLSGSSKIFSITVVLLVAIGLVAGGSYLAFSNGSETHTVCIHESPPWFDEPVLEIQEGDTVVWEHCIEDHNHGEDHKHVHTHPIEGISGPEHFSSGFGLVGHEDEGNEFRHTFTEEGIYEYICPTHPYMEGKIVVGESYHGEAEDLWPKESAIDNQDVLDSSEISGEGEVWVNTQFEDVEDQKYPGTITVLDAETWEIKQTISDDNFNNPHNLWNSYNEDFVFQTQWHYDKVSKIDTETKEVVTNKELGNAPAHLFVHPDEDKLYVTLNNEDRVIVTDLELNVIDEIETSFGGHGIWASPDGEYMTVAATLEERLDIINLQEGEVIESFDASGFPLATQIDHEADYAMISQLLEGQVRFIDLEAMEVEKDVEVGEAPIWAMPGPENEYIFVPNTGSATVSVIEKESLEVVKTLEAGAGAHGISFGEKQDEEGYYGYVSNKYEHYISVIDLEAMETKGHIEMPESKIGGNGILTLPNPYTEVRQDY